MFEIIKKKDNMPNVNLIFNDGSSWNSRWNTTSDNPITAAELNHFIQQCSDPMAPSVVVTPKTTQETAPTVVKDSQSPGSNATNLSATIVGAKWKH